jgi:photosystem II stability/assembly factor-like uncharacterized protein
MTTLYLATNDGPVVVSRKGDRWRASIPPDVRSASCVAVDPGRLGRVFYAGRRGAWRSDDAGESWRPVFEGIPGEEVTALAVISAERVRPHGVAYAGTEPSAVFRSEDGGETWRRCEGLSDLPSSREWSFPPRPETHHIRWLEPDPHEPGRLHVAIEAGALVRLDRAADGGATWRDRVSGGPYDTHQLAIHPDRPGRLWSAAGDGFYESDDAGDSWRRSEAGLRFRYCWSVAVDPGDPETAVLCAAPGPMQAHAREQAESAVFRRTGGGPWREVRAGLPEPQGQRAALVAIHPAESGVFYLATDDGLYRSSDAGATWRRLEADWPEGHGPGPRVHGLAAVASGPA